MAIIRDSRSAGAPALARRMRRYHDELAPPPPDDPPPPDHELDAYEVVAGELEEVPELSRCEGSLQLLVDVVVAVEPAWLPALPP
jgi:hypothetical protein